MKPERFLSIVLAFEFPLHSQGVFNPSIFTIEKFKQNENDKKSLRKGLYFAFAMNLLFSFAMFLYDETAGLIAFIVSIAIFIYYLNLVEK
ncbi:MAG: hypothetical protein QXW01_03715 [Candidatus Aenigmatarchaeota archaeon]